MKNNENKAKFKLWEVIIITLISSIIMGVSTGYVVFRNSDKNKYSNNSKELNEFIDSYNNIINNYYDNIDESELIDAAINGMLKYLDDPYTTYLDESNTNILSESLKGTYEGIGIKASQSDYGILIVNVIENTPAYYAGLMVNDLIIKINDTNLENKNVYEAVDLIKNSTTDSIKIDIKRNDEIITFNIPKKTLNVPVVYKEIFNQNNHKIGYLNITKFSDTVYNQFKEQLTSLENSNIDSLIIDLRDNTGGFLLEATNIAELFLNKNKIIYYLEDKMSKDNTKDTTEEHRNYPIYIIINKGTASASEVLAAALKYSYGAILVGTTSYGKGKVQKTSQLSDGTMYKYTSAKWLTPNGDCIDNIGLLPDIEVELSEAFINDPTFENDNQIQTAIYELSK